MQISHECYDRRSAGFPDGVKRYCNIIIRADEGDDLDDETAERLIAQPLAAEGGDWQLIKHRSNAHGPELERVEHELVLEQVSTDLPPLDHGQWLKERGLALPRNKRDRRRIALKKDLDGYTAQVADATREFDGAMRARVEGMRGWARGLLKRVR